MFKLNVGSSHPSGIYRQKEWINIDSAKEFRRVIPASGLALPFRDNTFIEIHAIHVAEHIARRFHPLFFSELYRTAAPEGIVIIEVPNFLETCKKILASMEEGDLEKVRCWTLSVYGKHRYPGDAHAWGFYPALLKKDLESAKFSKVEILKDIYYSDHHTQEPVITARATK